MGWNPLAGVTARKNSGTATTTRKQLNFIEGTGITIAVSDDATDEEIEVTVTASASGGGRTLLSETDITSSVASVTITGIAQSHKDLSVILFDLVTADVATQDTPWLRFGNTSVDSGSNYGHRADFWGSSSNSSTTAAGTSIPNSTAFPMALGAGETGTKHAWAEFLVRDYTSAGFKYVDFRGAKAGAGATFFGHGRGIWINEATVERVQVLAEGGNLTGGTIFVYGVD